MADNADNAEHEVEHLIQHASRKQFPEDKGKSSEGNDIEGSVDLSRPDNGTRFWSLFAGCIQQEEKP